MSKYANLKAPRETHGVLLDLHAEIKNDSVFKQLCLSHGLLWEDVGNEPRGYNGPPPEDVQVLYVSAEPGPVTPTERLNLIPAITNAPWLDGFDLNLQEHYWRKNLEVICESIWPTDTVANMDTHLGGMQSFWVSLPEGATTKAIPRPALDYWRQHYAHRLFGLFPDAVVLAAGLKAQKRLKRLEIDFIGCGAVTKPGCNFKKVKESWPVAGKAISDLLNHAGGQ
jgi:hypothetical protein